MVTWIAFGIYVIISIVITVWYTVKQHQMIKEFDKHCKEILEDFKKSMDRIANGKD